MEKKIDVHYLHATDAPFMNSHGDVFKPEIIKSLIVGALDENLPSSARIAITRFRWSRKLDGAGQPISVTVGKVVTLTTLRRWYRQTTGESITKRTVKEEEDNYIPPPD